MEVRYKLFPYPVLWKKNDDYINSIFTSEIIVEQEIRKLKIKVNFELKDKKLEEMLNNNEIEFLLHIECPKTSYRKIVVTSNKIKIEELKDENIMGRIQLSTFIVAKKNLFSYSNPNFNSEYFGIKFNIEKGNILAIGNQYKLNIDKEKDSLSSIPSIFTIYKKETLEDIGMEVEYHSDKIKIGLNITQYEAYNELASNNLHVLNIINSGIIFPVLVYILEKIKTDFDGVEEYRWFQVLKSILSKYGYKLDRTLLENEISISLAQKLLDLPIGKALLALKNQNEEEVEEE